MKHCPEHGPLLPDQCYLVGRLMRCKQCFLHKTRLWREAKRYEALQHYSGSEPSCSACGEKEPSFLGLDHVDNGGRNHQSTAGFTSSGLWAHANGYPPIFQVLCHNCNILKTWNTGISSSASRNLKVKIEVLKHYSSGLLKCLWCEVDDIWLLTLDHIDGGGKCS